MTRPFYNREQCEARAVQVLQQYQRLRGVRLSLPINVDLIGEVVCGLIWDWADIADDGGPPIWGRLLPAERRVEMNERHLGDFGDNSGLDRFTRAHEIGHWELHAEHTNPHQLPLIPLEPASSPPTVYCRGRDDGWIEKHADWFAAALLMPRDAFCGAAHDFDLLRWDHMKTFKAACDVSWQALYIRLGTFGIPFVDHAGNVQRP